jgi:hypothetical protein
MHTALLVAVLVAVRLIQVPAERAKVGQDPSA